MLCWGESVCWVLYVVLMSVCVYIGLSVISVLGVCVLCWCALSLCVEFVYTDICVDVCIY